jgi:hypothetical protein
METYLEQNLIKLAVSNDIRAKSNPGGGGNLSLGRSVNNPAPEKTTQDFALDDIAASKRQEYDSWRGGDLGAAADTHLSGVSDANPGTPEYEAGMKALYEEGIPKVESPVGDTGDADVGWLQKIQDLIGMQGGQDFWRKDNPYAYGAGGLATLGAGGLAYSMMGDDEEEEEEKRRREEESYG